MRARHQLGGLPLLLIVLLIGQSNRSDLTAAGLEDSAGWDSTAALTTDTIEAIGGYRPLDTLWHDFGAFFTEGWDLLRRPGEWQSTDLNRAGALASLLAGGFLIDEEIRDGVTSLRGRDGDRLVEGVNHAGENIVGLAAIAGLYVPGLLLDLPWLRVAGRHVGQTLIYSALLGSIMKGGFGRHRPYLEDGPYTFSGPWQSDNSLLSLPSGHTIVAFSIASTLSAEIGNPWATAGFYTAAAAVGFGRIYLDQHWGSDVILGAVIASVIGHTIGGSGEQTTSTPISLNVQPTVTRGVSIGITASW